MPQRTRRAFTLIELLVVIAIIAILAAILFPVFAKAREKARQSSCQSNEKQMGLAVMQYVSDYDERFPAAWVYIPGGQTAWVQVVYPYAKNAQMFLCPSDSAPISWNPNYVTRWSYTWNNIQDQQTYWTLAIGQGVFSTSPWGLHTGYRCLQSVSFGTGPAMADVQDAAGSILIADGLGPNGLECWSDIHFDYGTNPQVAGRHNEGFNAIYGDGHVKWRKFKSTKPGEWTIQSGD